MSKAKRRLNRPLKFQKALFINALTVVVACGAFFAAYSYYPVIADDIQEFVAETIDAEVESVLVSGVKYSENTELLTAIGLSKGDSLVGYKTTEARARLQELPWVREAVVERQLPSTLSVQVYEYNPIARLVEESAIWAVDKKGHKIIDVKDGFKHLPVIQGENAATHAAELFVLLAEKASHIPVKVVEARYIGERRWNLGFETGSWVQLPEQNPARALDILARLHNRKDVLNMDGTMIDLRLEDRIVLRMPSDKKLQERIL